MKALCEPTQCRGLTLMDLPSCDLFLQNPWEETQISNITSACVEPPHLCCYSPARRRYSGQIVWTQRDLSLHMALPVSDLRTSKGGEAVTTYREFSQVGAEVCMSDLLEQVLE